MRVSALVSSAILGLAAAGPVRRDPSEEVTVSNLVVRENRSPSGEWIKAYSFNLSSAAGSGADNVACVYQGPPQAENPPVSGGLCGDSPFSASLLEAEDNGYLIEVLHHYGQGPWQGSFEIPAVRRAGGDGPADYVGEQVGGPATFRLFNTNV